MNFSYNKLFVFVLAALLISACGSGENDDIKIPNTILSEEKFTKLLVDFSLAESAGNLNVKNLPAEKMDSAYAFDPLEENNVSRSQYDSAVSFYSKHPSIYKKIYENVLATLSKMQLRNDSAKVDPVSK